MLAPENLARVSKPSKIEFGAQVNHTNVMLMNAVTKALAKQRRKMLSNAIFERHGGVVQLGVFEGLKLGGDSNISRGSLALKIFGLYEPKVVAEIASAAPFDDLINLGAADGYMAIGPVFAGLCKRSICFELAKTGRQAVAANARLYGVSDAVVIRGAADDSFLGRLSEISRDLSRSVVLCDIEGAEFDVFSTSVLETLKATRIIIELHDQLMPEGTALREALIARIPDGTRHRLPKAGVEPFEGIEDLERMHDIDRALVMSEGRKVIGEWLVIEPAE